MTRYTPELAAGLYDLEQYGDLVYFDNYEDEEDLRPF